MLAVDRITNTTWFLDLPHFLVCLDCLLARTRTCFPEKTNYTIHLVPNQFFFNKANNRWHFSARTTYKLFFSLTSFFLILKKVRLACTLATEYYFLQNNLWRHMLHRRQSVDPVGPKQDTNRVLVLGGGQTSATQYYIACNQSHSSYPRP